ncbi:hypothetical protein EUX98_g9696 [Antrodiella citrinella]|uniref:Peptidase A1 domain-containing protein n=1 Tax=Antrodiella citrinella TaxID=2447956 RepID=A0A4S4LTS7_9APHY|nr:hypothetical protein EUX98_g9696 [Antrodiella citrinella]
MTLPFLPRTSPPEGALTLTDDANELWQGTISVGTPAVSCTVDFDTGSSDIFLPRAFTLRYGDGSQVSGEQYTDTVPIIAALTATKQTLYTPDGFLGMAYQYISEFNSPPFVQTLIEQEKISQPVFAFKLASTGVAVVPGRARVLANMDSVLINNKTALGSVLTAIIDTGTTFIIGDTTSVKKFYTQIPGAKDASSTVGAGFYTVPCNAIPTVQLTFGGRSFSIPPAVFNLGRVTARSQDCVGRIVASSQSV